MDAERFISLSAAVEGRRAGLQAFLRNVAPAMARREASIALDEANQIGVGVRPTSRQGEQQPQVPVRHK